MKKQRTVPGVMILGIYCKISIANIVAAIVIGDLSIDCHKQKKLNNASLK